MMELGLKYLGATYIPPNLSDLGANQQSLSRKRPWRFFEKVE